MNYKEVIESRYNRQNWQLLLHDIFGKKIKFWNTPSTIPTSSQFAKQALWLGTITLSDNQTISIYEVELSDSVDIERNRRGIRDMLLTDWRNNGNAGAFMFCYRKNESVLRFSYVSEAWTFADDGSYQKESTDAKRFTYLLGEGHRSRTAIQQFEKLRDSSLTLKDLTKAFSVDAVSDMFFKGYKQQYEDIIFFVTGKRMVKVANKWEERQEGKPNEYIMQQFAKFDNQEKAIRDYVKKLMGRLVFLQFLQKKGWLGVPAGESWGTGDREFIQNLFANCQDKDHFIDNVLEVLFNDLNTERKGDLATPSLGGGRGRLIPYLNGGLFERDATDEAEFPLPAKYMQSLLDFFASYNFTIDENDPDDAEVGVDPEMLGRIFENLLEDNKDKGAFYTPKEIVSYMCRESLIAYLQTGIEDEATKEAIRQFVTTHDVKALGTNDKFREQVDEALKNVKICDPAIGSGAFPMGLLKELFQCRTAIEGIEQSKAAEIKKHIIQQNIYGVDIERGAVDIARLRFWLSLIVDEETPQALPNLDFKIMQGNSLLEQYKGVDLSTMTELKTEKHGVVQTTMFDDMIDVLRLDLRKMLEEYYDCTDHHEKQSLRAKIIDNVKQQLREQSIDVNFGDLDLSGNNQFMLWHTWFYDVFSQGGFDIVIGNPPYVSVKAISSEDKAIYSGRFKTGKGRFNLFTLFLELFHEISRIEGTFCLIIPEGIYSNIEYRFSRELLVQQCKIDRLCTFTKRVFDASVDTTILLISKMEEMNERILIDTDIKQTSKILSQIDIAQIPYFLIPVRLEGQNKELVEKLLLSSKFDRISDNLEIQQGIIYTGQAKEDVFADYVKDSTYKPILDGRDVVKWRINWDIKEYDKFLSYTNKLHRPREERLFLAEKKILLPRRATKIVATIDYQQYYALNTAYICLNKNNKYETEFLLGIMNSKIVDYFYSMLFMGWQITIPALEVIPIPCCSKEKQFEICLLVKKAIEEKRTNLSADTSMIEQQIDRLVYQLYGLTEDEIKIVESK
jgi:type I restriction-modification system DNA methylase subunit